MVASPPCSFALEEAEYDAEGNVDESEEVQVRRDSIITKRFIITLCRVLLYRGGRIHTVYFLCLQSFEVQ